MKQRKRIAILSLLRAVHANHVAPLVWIVGGLHQVGSWQGSRAFDSVSTLAITFPIDHGKHSISKGNAKNAEVESQVFRGGHQFFLLDDLRRESKGIAPEDSFRSVALESQVCRVRSGLCHTRERATPLFLSFRPLIPYCPSCDNLSILGRQETIQNQERD